MNWKTTASSDKPCVSVQHHPSLQPPGEGTHVLRVQDVVLQRLARPRQLLGDIGLLSEILPRQPGDRLLEPGFQKLNLLLAGATLLKCHLDVREGGRRVGNLE